MSQNPVYFIGELLSARGPDWEPNEMPLTLTDEQKERYWDQGHVIVPGILRPGEIECYKPSAGEIANGDVPESGETMPAG